MKCHGKQKYNFPYYLIYFRNIILLYTDGHAEFPENALRNFEEKLSPVQKSRIQFFGVCENKHDSDIMIKIAMNFKDNGEIRLEVSPEDFEKNLPEILGFALNKAIFKEDKNNFKDKHIEKL